MSVVMTMGLKVDPNQFEQIASEHGEELAAILAKAKQAGVMHHVFCAGDGEVMVLDEWPDEQSALGFLDGTQEQIGALFAGAGVEDRQAPRFWRLLETGDRL